MEDILTKRTHLATMIDQIYEIYATAHDQEFKCNVQSYGKNLYAQLAMLNIQLRNIKNIEVDLPILRRELHGIDLPNLQEDPFLH
jgi:hypothetical protein